MNDDERYDYLFKIVLIGDTNVGKTNLLSQLTKKQPLDSSKPTIGVEFSTKTFKIDNVVIKAQIWDTAGQERYHAITTAYYRGSYGAVVVYDITQKNTLKNAIDGWLKKLRNVTDPQIPIVLLGNKNDLEKQRSIPTDSGRAAAANEGLGFFETSAISGDNVDMAFKSLVEQVYKREKHKLQTLSKAKVRQENIVGKPLEIKKTKKSSSCC